MPSSAVRNAQMRIRIAQAAARLMAEDGLTDIGLAKRKAARQLGAPDSHSLPSNEEIEAALAEYQQWFVADHADHVRELREQALAVMEVLRDFNPLLVGAVASGQATEHAQIELDLFLDSTKAFEQFLLNHDIEFKSLEKAGRSYFQLYANPADVWVRVFPENARHAMARSRDEPAWRLDRQQLQQLLASV